MAVEHNNVALALADAVDILRGLKPTLQDSQALRSEVGRRKGDVIDGALIATTPTHDR